MFGETSRIQLDSFGSFYLEENKKYNIINKYNIIEKYYTL